MELVYLSATDARTQLIATGTYSDADAPSQTQLAMMLSAIEVEVDSWLHWRPAPSEYRESAVIGSATEVKLSHFPILSITAMEGFLPHSPLSHPIDLRCISQIFKGGCIVTLGFGLAHYRSVTVCYRAGLKPLPPIFAHSVFQVLQAALQRSGPSGNLTFLHEPIPQVSKLKLPGGLEKGFHPYPAPSGQNAPLQSEKDRLFAPLSMYRRRLTL